MCLCSAGFHLRLGWNYDANCPAFLEGAESSKAIPGRIGEPDEKPHGAEVVKEIFFVHTFIGAERPGHAQLPGTCLASRRRKSCGYSKE